MQQMFSEVWDKTLTVSYTECKCNAKHDGHIFLLLTQLEKECTQKHLQNLEST